MKHEIIFRIVIKEPLEGTAMRVQEGKDKLLEPSAFRSGSIEFDFPITVDLSGPEPNFLGKFAQGPKAARFVYVNSGTYAGQTHSCWGRRAKLSLMSITKKQIEDVIDRGTEIFETNMPGTGADGGPICASVKGLEWRIAKK